MVYVLGARTIFIVAVAGEAFTKNHNLSGFRQFGPRVSGHNRHEIHTCESSSVTLREKSTTNTKNHKIQNSSMAAEVWPKTFHEIHTCGKKQQKVGEPYTEWYGKPFFLPKPFCICIYNICDIFKYIS